MWFCVVLQDFLSLAEFEFGGSEQTKLRKAQSSHLLSFGAFIATPEDLSRCCRP